VRSRDDGDPRRAFGASVRQRRQSFGLSQEALAHACGLHRTYVGGVERGERNVSLLNMVRLAEALSLKLSQLVETMERNW